MMTETDLPLEFDVVVLGTGVPESIIAAAAARLGRSVLHLDGHEFYGSGWASHNLEALIRLIDESNSDSVGCCTSTSAPPPPPPPPPPLPPPHQQNNNVAVEEFVADGESFVACPSPCQLPFSRFSYRWHCSREGTEEEGTIEKNHGELCAEEQHEEERAVILNGEQEAQLAEHTVNKRDASHCSSAVGKKRCQVEKEWRKFSIDLTPKVLKSRGSMVELLIRSGVGRYAEFKSVDRILGELDGQLVKIPCSRAEVFQSSLLSIVDKRRLMKLLQLALNLDNIPPEQFAAHQETSFADFLVVEQELSEGAAAFVLHSIAMVPRTANVVQGLEAVASFLQGVGRFGDSPYLWTVYGAGELPQCFCRLAAVNGAVYCLRKPVDGWFCDADGRAVAILTEGQRISCQHLVMNKCFVSLSKQKSNTVKRCSLITDASILPGGVKESISLYNFYPADGDKQVRLLEVGFAAGTCPKDYFLVHMTSSATAVDSSEDVFAPVIEHYFNGEPTAAESETETSGQKPNIIWSCRFQMDRAGARPMIEDGLLDNNIAITDVSDASLDYESAVVAARAAFNKLWPDEDFFAVLSSTQTPEDVDNEVTAGDNGFQPQNVT